MDEQTEIEQGLPCSSPCVVARDGHCGIFAAKEGLTHGPCSEYAPEETEEELAEAPPEPEPPPACSEYAPEEPQPVTEEEHRLNRHLADLAGYPVYEANAPENAQGRFVVHSGGRYTLYPDDVVWEPTRNLGQGYAAIDSVLARALQSVADKLNLKPCR